MMFNDPKSFYRNPTLGVFERGNTNEDKKQITNNTGPIAIR